MNTRKKQKQRHFVTVYPHRRKDNQKMQYLVCWTPTKNNRRRMAFSDPVEAEEEADRVEELMQHGLIALTTIPSSVMVSVNYFLTQLPDDNGATLHKIFSSYFEGNNGNSRAVPAGAKVKVVGKLFIDSRSSAEDFSLRHISTVRQHVNRFVGAFDARTIDSITHGEVKQYLDDVIGGVAKTRVQHLITLKSWFRWARDIGANNQKFLPAGQTAPEMVTPPKVVKNEHEVYSPEEFIRILIAAPTNCMMFFVLGQFAGIRSEERLRLLWSDWRADEGNKIVCNTNITKTSHRRLVDVEPNLAEWMMMFRGETDERMVPLNGVFGYTAKALSKAGVKSKQNALRAGYASYHYELYDNPGLTSKNTGHSVIELETTYKAIQGVTKAKAREMFNITPRVVLAFAEEHQLGEPEWSGLFLHQAAA